MKLPYQDNNRQVIPRWRDSDASAARGELDSLDQRGDRRKLVRELAIKAKLTDWEEYRTLSFAADLIATAVVMNRPEVATAAAQSVLESPVEANVAVQRMARLVLGLKPDSTADPRTDLFRLGPQRSTERIRGLRRRLRREQRNALGWTDLALAYVDIGKRAGAARAMSTALALDPENRFILRAAARLYKHLEDPERGLHVLRRAERARQDPWLVAAEIALSDSVEQSPRFIKEARRIISANQFPQFSTSELMAALATVELASGSRRARKLFRESLREPTENAVAQAEWAAREHHVGEVDLGLLQRPDSYEARSIASFHAAEWEESFTHALGWFQDEPFSIHPAIFASYVASIGMRDHGKAIEVDQCEGGCQRRENEDAQHG